MNQNSLQFWLSRTNKVLSFGHISGYEKIAVRNMNELWETIYALLEIGYRVR